MVADFVKAGFDVPFQYPCGLVPFESTVRIAPLRPHNSVPSKPIRVWVGQCFGNGVQGLQIQRLHGSILHRRDTRGRFFPLDFGMYTRRSGRALYPRRCIWCMAIPLLSGSFQMTLSTPGCSCLGFLSLVVQQGFAAQRMGQQVLQGLHLVPLTGLRCLNVLAADAPSR